MATIKPGDAVELLTLNHRTGKVEWLGGYVIVRAIEGTNQVRLQESVGLGRAMRDTTYDLIRPAKIIEKK
jgi:hypothetical protein